MPAPTGVVITPVSNATLLKHGFTHIITIDYSFVATMTSGTAQAIFPANLLGVSSNTFPIGNRVAQLAVNVATAFTFAPGTLVATVGDGGDAARFFASSDIKTAGFVTENALTKKPYTYTAADTIDLTVTAGAGALTSVTAGSLEIYLGISDLNKLRTGAG